MGYTSDTPVSLDRSIRQNDACVWIADETALRTVEERVRSLLPQEVGGGRLMGLNARWRCYRCTALPTPHPTTTTTTHPTLRQGCTSAVWD